MTSQPRRRRLEWEDLGDVTVVTFTDKKILEEPAIQDLGDQLTSLVEEMGKRRLLLNFTQVESLSSAALGKLVTLNRKIKEAQGMLVLCGINANIMEVFEITKLNQIIDIRRDEQEGLQAF